MNDKVLFSEEHIWIINDNGKATLGVSDFAQKELGNIMFLNLPDIGDVLSIGERFGDIESIKTVTDLVSPIGGEVININEQLIDEPENINESPYDCWFVEVKVDSVCDNLMDEESYLKYLDELLKQM